MSRGGWRGRVTVHPGKLGGTSPFHGKFGGCPSRKTWGTVFDTGFPAGALFISFRYPFPKNVKTDEINKQVFISRYRKVLDCDFVT